MLALLPLVQLTPKKLKFAFTDYSRRRALESLNWDTIFFSAFRRIHREWVFFTVVNFCTLCFIIIATWKIESKRFRWCRGTGCGWEWTVTARSWLRRRPLCMTVKLGFGELMLKEGSVFNFLNFEIVLCTIWYIYIYIYILLYSCNLIDFCFFLFFVISNLIIVQRTTSHSILMILFILFLNWL